MGYPQGYGPEAGRFAGVPWAGGTGGPGSPRQAAIGEAFGPRPLWLTARADATLTATFPAVAAVRWVRRLTVQGDDTSATALVYVGDPAPENLVTGTRHGWLDEWDAAQPFIVPEQTPLSVVWSAGAVCVARLEYVEG